MPVKISLLLVSVLLLLAGSMGAQVPEAIPKIGLNGYWPFSGNANDASGNNYNGRIYGVKPVKDRFGNPNSAYAFNGVSDFIATDFKGILGTHARAVSFWIKTTSAKVTANVAWGSVAYRPNSGHKFNCSFNYRSPGATLDISDACITYEPNRIINDNKWHHFVFQFDTAILNKVEVFQDGSLIKHSAAEYYPYTPINTLEQFPVIFGCLFFPKDMSAPYKERPEDFSYFFEGEMDDVAIYNKALTQEEILSLYRAPNPNPKMQDIILKWLLIFLAVAAGLILIRYYASMRFKRALRIEMEKNYIQNNRYEQENKVLKAQMDPHFIFNSLNTLQQFILTNENEKAHQYLYKFSRLIRQIIESNIKDSISLEDEVDLIEKYLEIESLRFDNIFNYHIHLPDVKDISELYIPHFMIQPFVENAIWHGLLPKDGDKQLDIVFEVIDKNTLCCTITDNGIGRKNISEEKPDKKKKKSLAINFIRQRLELMSKIRKANYQLKIEDIVNETGDAQGTRVIITMPIM